MAGSMLYLVDQDNRPVKPEISIAVEAAFRWSVREYRNMDEADLASMAEAVALGMSKRLEEIQSPRRLEIFECWCHGRFHPGPGLWRKRRAW